MPIDEEQTQQLLSWIHEKGVRQDCAACGHNDWQPGDIIAPPIWPKGGGTAIGGPSFPVVQLICKRCAYVMHFATPLMKISAHSEVTEIGPGIGKHGS